ncbi:hypothetical protein THIAE_06125 [Thiomicrospira aerophila AL3]|uniref:Uncharacterized protein n=1 Tax=Thiomicrospira aerophila AL3 TaxID=717772 RepID=W0DV28_9GAMM|nr:hypothetical protein [Thiomicrospira aerophila]AHF02292.1 hypothetical protein THIAE_06125 [Thiomicrospira aerophila AL3]
MKKMITKLTASKEQLLGVGVFGLAIGMAMVADPVMASSVPAAPGINVGSIVDESDGMDNMLTSIMGWVIQILSAIAMAGAALGYTFALWTGFQKLQDDNESKSYKMGNFMTTAIVGIIVVAVVVVMGMIMYNYGGSLRGA